MLLFPSLDTKTTITNINQKYQSTESHETLTTVLSHDNIRQAIVNLKQLECGPMPNVMAVLPNIGSALCSTPQSLADGHYYSAVHVQ